MPTSSDCTDVIVHAMEQADNMESLIVIYKLRDTAEDEAGVGWQSNMNTIDALGLIEMAKHGLLSRRQE